MRSSTHHRLWSAGALYLLAAFTAIIAIALPGSPARATFATVHNFLGSPPDGAEPLGTVIQDPATGNFYGTTSTGGTHGLGVVYCINPNFGVTIIHNFAGPDGSKPACTLILETPPTGGPALLYGTTLLGGKFNDGVVFKIGTTGVPYVVLHSFAGAPADGANPYAGVILASDGRLYGTTLFGGKYSLGTTYGITTGGGGFAVTHSFRGLSVAGLPPDGANPFARLFEWKPGIVVGTTFVGGQANFGTVFTEKLLGGAYGLLHQFVNTPDGANPSAELIGIPLATGMVLWGTTKDGGAFTDGTIFSVTPAGTMYTDEYDFHGGGDGAAPGGGLAFDGATGNIYGTTEDGGPTGNGVMFIAKPVGPAPIPEGVLHPFSFGDGAHPMAAPYLDLAGAELWSTTRDGGIGFDGTLFFQTP